MLLLTAILARAACALSRSLRAVAPLDTRTGTKQAWKRWQAPTEVCAAVTPPSTPRRMRRLRVHAWVCERFGFVANKSAGVTLIAGLRTEIRFHCSRIAPPCPPSKQNNKTTHQQHRHADCILLAGCIMITRLRIPLEVANT